MSSNDPSSDLDSRIAAIVESTVDTMRQELVQRLQEVISSTVAQAAAVPAPPPAAGDTDSELFDAIATMDRGGSQQEVLAALLEGVGRFAGRSALFLTRADGAQGWGSYGFDEISDDLQEITLSYSAGPLATLAEGQGCVALSGEACADICRRLGASAGSEGLLVPFVLRDRLAAALYVDRFDQDPPLGSRAVQLLTFVGALAVEGLALRQRSETSTLQMASAAEDAPGVALWEAPATVEPPAAAVETAPAEAPAVEAPPVEAPAAEPATAEPALSEPVLSEPQITEATPPPVEALIETPAEAAAEPADALPEEPPAEVSLDELVDDEAPEIATRTIPILEPVTEAPPETTEMPGTPVEEPSTPSLTTPALETTLEAPAETLDALDEPAAAPQVDEPMPWAAPPEPEAPAAAEEPSAAPPTEIAPPPEVETPSESTQVQPPTDVTGPGWAFTASRAAAEAGDDAQHEEARRLARLLVTEIKLYNEEQVEEGRRSNDIYARLREDIDRSRQIFNERVDDAVRQENDYFHEEMVRILGGGNAETLGL